MHDQDATPDLRSFLSELTALSSANLRTVTRPVTSTHELSAVVKLAETQGNPVLKFDHVDGGSIPVVCGLFAAEERLARAMGVELPEATATFIERLSGGVPTSPAKSVPAQEVCRQGEDVDLAELPIPVHSPRDGGRYITAGVCLVRDPVSGAHNAGIYRVMVHGRNEITILAGPDHDLGRILAKAKSDGRATDVAIVIGAHPALHLASQAKVPVEADSLELMGSLIGESIPVARGLTVDVDVPAHAEIVLEGRVLPDRTLPEGPFGEFSYYYGSEPDAPVCEVTALTRRAAPWYLDIHPAHADHRALWLFPGREVRLLQLLQAQVPGVRAVHLPLAAGGMMAHISLEKSHDGDAQRALMIALSSDIYIKHAFVFDPDVDIYDFRHAAWALAVRFQADTDLFTVPYAQGFSEDPSSYGRLDRRPFGGLTTKCGFDVTVPLGTAHPDRADLLPEAYADIRLEDYLDA